MLDDIVGTMTVIIVNCLAPHLPGINREDIFLVVLPILPIMLALLLVVLVLLPSLLLHHGHLLLSLLLLHSKLLLLVTMLLEALLSHGVPCPVHLVSFKLLLTVLAWTLQTASKKSKHIICIHTGNDF